MADMNKLLSQLMGSGAAGGFTGGLAGGLASSMLTSKKGRKLGKKALKMGGIAAVGALAYSAFQKYSGDKNQIPQGQAAPQSTAPFQAPPEGSSFMPAQNDSQGQQKLGLTLVRAMIAAARSDGRLDAQESQAIFQRIETLDLTSEERNLLIEEMGKPVDIDALISCAVNQEIASEIYVASLLAVEVDTVEEKSYLGMLAARLKLPQNLVQELHNQVESQLVPVE